MIPTTLLASPGQLAATSQEVDSSTGVPNFLPGNQTTPYSLADLVLNLVFIVAGAIALFGMLYGAVKYLTAGTGPGGDEGKRMITGAVVSLIIVALAYVLVSTLINRYLGGA